MAVGAHKFALVYFLLNLFERPGAQDKLRDCVELLAFDVIKIHSARVEHSAAVFTGVVLFAVHKLGTQLPTFLVAFLGLFSEPW